MRPLAAALDFLGVLASDLAAMDFLAFSFFFYSFLLLFVFAFFFRATFLSYLDFLSAVVFCAFLDP